MSVRRPLEALGAAWERWWFTDGSTAALGLFRILFAVALWREVGTTLTKGVFAIEGGMHLPYFDWIPLMSATLYERLHAVQYPLIALLGLGIFGRAASGSLFLIQGWVLFADQLNFRNHPYFFVLLLLVLALAPVDESFSVRGLVRGLRAGRRPIEALLGRPSPLTFQRLIVVQISLVYLIAGAHKFNRGFLDGHVLSYYASRSLPGRMDSLTFGVWPEAWTVPLREFLANPANMAGPSIFSAILELTLPLFLLWPRARPWAMLVGIGFHVNIALTMNIKVFSIAMIASYLLFLDPRTIPRLVRRLGGSRSSQRKTNSAITGR